MKLDNSQWRRLTGMGMDACGSIDMDVRSKEDDAPRH